MKSPTSLQTAAGAAMLAWRRAQAKADAAKQKAKAAVREAIEEEAAARSDFMVMDAWAEINAIGYVPDYEAGVMDVHHQLAALLKRCGYKPPDVAARGGGGSGGR